MLITGRMISKLYKSDKYKFYKDLVELKELHYEKNNRKCKRCLSNDFKMKFYNILKENPDIISFCKSFWNITRMYIVFKDTDNISKIFVLE